MKNIYFIALFNPKLTKIVKKSYISLDDKLDPNAKI